MDWNDVRYFLALARLGSVRAAGAELGVSHSTVARRVEALEAQLSARLFDRTRDGYTLTDAGQQMMPGAERVELEMAGLERELLGADEKIEGPVRLTVCDAYVSALVLAALRPLCDAHQGVELCVVTDSRPFNLTKREADLALRMLGADQPPPEHLMARRLTGVAIASYVGRAHAERLDPGRGGRGARWIAFDDRKTMAPIIAASSYPDLPQWGAATSIRVAAQLAREGFGLAMLPCYAGDADPDLVRLAEPDVAIRGALWLLCHPDLRTNARLSAAREAVRSGLERHAPLFRGEGQSD